MMFAYLSRKDQESTATSVLYPDYRFERCRRHLANSTVVDSEEPMEKKCKIKRVVRVVLLYRQMISKSELKTHCDSQVALDYCLIG